MYNPTLLDQTFNVLLRLQGFAKYADTPLCQLKRFTNMEYLPLFAVGLDMSTRMVSINTNPSGLNMDIAHIRVEDFAVLLQLVGKCFKDSEVKMSFKIPGQISIQHIEGETADSDGYRLMQPVLLSPEQTWLEFDTPIEFNGNLCRDIMLMNVAGHVESGMEGAYTVSPEVYAEAMLLPRCLPTGVLAAITASGHDGMLGIVDLYNLPSNMPDIEMPLSSSFNNSFAKIASNAEKCPTSDESGKR